MDDQRWFEWRLLCHREGGKWQLQFQPQCSFEKSSTELGQTWDLSREETVLLEKVAYLKGLRPSWSCQCCYSGCKSISNSQFSWNA